MKFEYDRDRRKVVFLVITTYYATEFEPTCYTLSLVEIFFLANILDLFRPLI